MAKKQKGLGKGLGALFSESPELSLEQPDSGPNTLPIQKIEPNPNQPRQDFDPEALEDLANSIRDHGLIQPITVRPTESGYYQIIAGERRWRASRMAGLTEVPVNILEADDQTAAELALIENLQREDLNPVEEARGYETLIETYGLTQEGVADILSVSRPAVANTLRLLKLPEAVLNLVEIGALSAGHARALITLESEALQVQAANQITRQQLSVRQTELLVKRLKRQAPEEPAADPLAVDYYRECEVNLTRQLGRKVKIRKGKNGGTFQLDYYGDEDLQQLIEGLQTLRPREK